MAQKNYSLKQFNYNKETGSLTAEASSLGLKVGQPPEYLLRITSHVTGKIFSFEFRSNIISNEELVGWVFSPVAPNYCPVKSLKIFND